jgi:hypothetical protein
MDALLQVGKKVEAAALARDQWKWIATVACPEEHRSHFVRSAYEAFAQSANPAEAMEFLMDVLSRVPRQLAENQRSQAFDALIAELVRVKRTEEALGWAKVHFMVCPFAEEAVQGALKNLQKAYLARSEGLKEWAAFVYAQQNRFRDNPLVGVPPPQLTAGQRAALLANAGQEATARVSALLLLGDGEAALEVAQQFLLASGGTREAVDNVCRCLKAQDLRLERANQFIQCLKWGRVPQWFG